MSVFGFHTQSACRRTCRHLDPHRPPCSRAARRRQRCPRSSRSIACSSCPASVCAATISRSTCSRNRAPSRNYWVSADWYYWEHNAWENTENCTNTYTYRRSHPYVFCLRLNGKHRKPKNGQSNRTQRIRRFCGSAGTKQRRTDGRIL